MAAARCRTLSRRVEILAALTLAAEGGAVAAAAGPGTAAAAAAPLAAAWLIWLGLQAANSGLVLAGAAAP